MNPDPFHHAVWGRDSLNPQWIEIVSRSPVNVNTARREVLTSLLVDLEGVFLVERRGGLTATADLLDLFLGDVERLRGGASAKPDGAVPLSSITGNPLTVESQREILVWIGEMARRERQLVVVVETRHVAQEILSLAGSREPRTWGRALPNLKKSLQALEEAVREERSDGLNALMADVEMLFNTAPSVVESGVSAGPAWEKLVLETFRAGATLEESLRNPHP